MKLVSRGAAWTLAFWCLGLASVMLRYAAPDLAERYAHPQLSQYYIVFAPFWVGDLIAVSSSFALQLLYCCERTLKFALPGDSLLQ
jgi:hypothetical protein